MINIKNIFYKIIPKKWSYIIIPLIIEQFLIQVTSMVDVFMTSFINNEALAGVSLASQIDRIVISFFSFFIISATINISISYGKGDEKGILKGIYNNIFFVFIFSILITILLLFFQNEIILILFGKVESSVLLSINTYYFYIIISIPFIALSTTISTILKISKNTKFALNLSTITNVLNLVLDAIFIFVFNMGVFGVVFSTLLVRILQLIILLIFFNKKYLIFFNISKTNFLPILKNKISLIKLKEVKNIIFLGLPSGIEGALFNLGNLLVKTIIAGLGTTVISANAIAINFGSLSICVGLGMAQAVVPILGFTKGQSDNLNNIKIETKELLKITYKLLIFSNLIILIFINPLLQFYNVSNEIKILVFLCQICHSSFNILLYPTSFVMQKVLVVFKENKYTFLVSTISMYLGRYFIFLILANYIGIFGLYIGMAVDWFIRSICFYYKYNKILNYKST